MSCSIPFWGATRQPRASSWSLAGERTDVGACNSRSTRWWHALAMTFVQDLTNVATFEGVSFGCFRWCFITVFEWWRLERNAKAFSTTHGVLRIFGLCYLEGDSQIALVAVTSNPSALQFPRCTLAQIKQNLLFHQFPAASTLQICLRFAAQKLQNTKKIVLAAVSKEPLGRCILPALSCVKCYA